MSAADPRFRETNSGSPPTAPVKSAVEARDAVTGHGVRYVLAISLVLVITDFTPS